MHLTHGQLFIPTTKIKGGKFDFVIPFVKYQNILVVKPKSILGPYQILIRFSYVRPFVEGTIWPRQKDLRG